MGEVRDVEPVVLVAGILYTDDAIRDGAMDRLTARYGDTVLASSPFDFTMTAYYTPEMGASLTKQFVAFRNLIHPGDLPAAKHAANAVEAAYAVTDGDTFRRRINIDPGYVTLAKLVLASTKDYSHRVFVGDRIYAEVTLRYEKKTFYTIDTTYPDYRTPLAIDFFNGVRRYLKEARRR